MAAEIGLVVERLPLCKDAGPSMVEYCSVWQLLPEELVSRILLFVPASGQARLRCVCKRWSQVLISRAFREESNLIAFRRGHHNFLSCSLDLDAGRGNNRRGGSLHKVDLPGATPPLPGRHMNTVNLRLFAGAGLVGVAHMSEEDSLGCWLLNMANKTSRQLPPLLLNRDPSTMSRCEWVIWLEPAPESSSSIPSAFQVVLMVVHNGSASSSALYTYTSTGSNAGWRTVHRGSHPRATWCLCVPTEGGYLGSCHQPGDPLSPWRTPQMRIMRWVWDSGCITQFPAPPSGVDLISDPGSGAVFGYQVDECDPPLLTVYRLDESSSSTPGWRCLYSGLPPLHHTEIGVTKVMCLANMLIIVVCSYNRTAVPIGSWHGLAYHMHDGSSQWLRLPPAMRHMSLYLEPMLVSQLRL